MLLLYVLILDSYMVGNDELSSLAQVTNEDTACLTPTIVDAEDLIGCDPYSDSAEREVDPEKTKRKIDRLLTVLKPYDVPEKLVSAGHRGSVDPFRTFSIHWHISWTSLATPYGPSNGAARFQSWDNT